MYISSSISIHNQTIFYSENNQKNKPTLLFLHGLSADRSDFLGILDSDIFSEYRTIALDLPGHGESPYIRSWFDIDSLVEIIHDFIKKVHIEWCLLIWHSMGWVLGTLLCENYPNLFQKFINIEWNLTESDCNFSRYIVNMEESEYLSNFWKFKNIREYALFLIELSENQKILEKYIHLQVPSIYCMGENSTIHGVNLLKSSGKKVITISNSSHHPFRENPKEFEEKLYLEICDSIHMLYNQY